MWDSSGPASHRAQAYWLVSELLLKAPTLELLIELTNASTDPEAGDDGYFRLPEDILEIMESGTELEALELKLGREFVRLFRGIREGHGTPPPYESLYIQTPDPQAVVIDVASFVRRAGFSSIPGLDDQADHLGGELRLMALLATAETDSVTSGKAEEAERFRQLQSDFMVSHIANWVHLWCKAARAQTTDTFFVMVIDSILALVKSDLEDLKISILTI